MSGNIGTDVTHGSKSVEGRVLGAGGIRMFTSLPREVSLADDGLTVHVKPPIELAGLRAGPAATTRLESFTCGQQTSLGELLTPDNNPRVFRIVLIVGCRYRCQRLGS
jgi:hypothetical protein